MISLNEAKKLAEDYISIGIHKTYKLSEMVEFDDFYLIFYKKKKSLSIALGDFSPFIIDKKTETIVQKNDSSINSDEFILKYLITNGYDIPTEKEIKNRKHHFFD